MISRYQVILNGVSMNFIHKDILILDVSHSPATARDEVFALNKRHGSRVYDRYFDKCQVTVLFAIRTYDILKRQSICDELVRWAKNGGSLQINDREWKSLQCERAVFPNISNVKDWTDSLSITFVAYAIPFWTDVIPTQLTLSGDYIGEYWFVPGNIADACVEVDIYPSNTLTYASLAVGDQVMMLHDLEVESGHSVHISYDSRMIQSIKTDAGISLLNKRTGVDDLLAPCGEKSYVSFSADTSSRVVFRTKGLWL